MIKMEYPSEKDLPVLCCSVPLRSVSKTCSTSGVLDEAPDTKIDILFSKLFFLPGLNNIPVSKLLTGVKDCLCTVLVTGIVE